MIARMSRAQAHQSQLGAAASDLEAKLIAFVREHRLPGGVAGVVCGDELVWTAATGFADVAAHVASEPNGMYSIASITKTFTGTAVIQLRDARRLGLDDPAVAWLPELRACRSPFGPLEAVTIRRMLSHESGLPAEPPGTDWAVPAYQGSAEQTLLRATEIAITVPPNARHKYSDLAYQLLGEIVSRASGIPFPRYVREAILDPLGMSATAFPPRPASLPGTQATGYGWRGLSDEFEPAPAMPPVWAEGGLWSCIEDLARWIAFQLAAYRIDVAGSPVLSAASLREMHRPRYLADDRWNQAWGISWCSTRQDETVWIGHSGGLPGFTSTICFDPASQVGSIVLLNGTSGSAALGTDLADAVRRTVTARPSEAHVPTATPSCYVPLLGVYARPGLGGWLLRLEWRDEKLTFIAPESPGWQVTLEASDDPDVYTISPDSDPVGESVVFRRLSDGSVASVLLLNSTWERLDPVRPVS